MFSASQFDATNAFSGGGFMSSQLTDSTPSAAKSRETHGLVPVTVKQISEAYQSGDEKSNFEINGVDISNVTLVGMVFNKTERNTDVNFTLDDGTGRIGCRRWVNEVFDTREMEEVQDGMYVRVNGHLKIFQGNRQLVAFSVRPVTNFDEIAFHFIECIHNHLQSSKIRQGSDTTHSQSKDSSLSTPVSSGSNGYQTASSSQFSGQFNTDGVKSCDQLVLDYLQQPSSIGKEKGIHKDELSQQLKVPTEILVEDLNKKWKRVILNTSPITPVEPCEWLNRMLVEIWPNYLAPKLSKRFSSIVQRRLKHIKSRIIEMIELQEFSLGSCPPTLGLQGTRWSTSGDQRIMRIGVDWDANDMSILLLAKVAKPFIGTARIVINSLHIKGDILLMPVLNGRAVLYSFVSVPEVRIGVAFGSGSQSLPATELPGVSSWLVKVFTDTLVKTMVEPRRHCYSLPAVELRKKAVGGIIHVTVLSANKLSKSSLRGSPSRRQQNPSSDKSSEDYSADNDLLTFVEVELGELTRRTNEESGSSPRWDSTFNMVLHGESGTLRFHLYACNPSSVKYDYLASCEIKVKYVTDDSTTFWAIGPNSGVIAKHVDSCGKEVEMVVPFEGDDAGELTVKLVLKEWQFSDGSQSLNNLRVRSLYGSSNFLSKTGRKINVTVVEGKDLYVKDRTRKLDPYVKLQYGKVLQKTRTAHGSDPIWNQKFEFDEIGGDECLTIKCYNQESFSDDNIGSARVNLEGLVEGSVRDVWVPLEKVSSGELRLQIEAVRVEDHEGSRGSTNGSGNGWIELVLIEAKDLVAADLRGTSDPYVRVHYGNLKKRTKVMYRTLNPQWNQTLEFPDDGSQLILYVKDHNALLPTSNIGDCVVEYQRLPPNERSDKWIPLQGVKRGEIHIQITRKVPDLMRKSLDSEPSMTRAYQISGQMKHMMAKFQSLIEEGNLEGLSTTLSELDNLEDVQEEYMVQLETEQMLLLNKIKELGQEILNSSPSISRRQSGN